MATRTGQSSARSSGGLTPAGGPVPAGQAADTVIVIAGDGRKEVLAITWSYGANGAGISAANLPLFGRLLVIAGVDASGFFAGGYLPTGPMGDSAPNGILAFGGRIVLDVDLSSGPGTNSQIVFPGDRANEGWIGTETGPLTIILTAPQLASGVVPAGIIGKLTVQFANVYASTMMPADGGAGYTFPKLSGPVR